VGVDASGLQTDARPKSVDLVRALETAWLCFTLLYKLDELSQSLCYDDITPKMLSRVLLVLSLCLRGQQ